MAERIGIRELKANLSAVLRRVKNGATVIITDRNDPVALLIPTGQDRESFLEQLVEAGRLSWSGGKPAGCARPPRVRGSSVSDAVEEDRR